MKNMIGKNGRKAGMEYCSPLTQNVLNAIAQIATSAVKLDTG